MSQKKKRFVAVGTGGRIPMFIDPIVRDYADHCELAALCDLSQVRMDYHRKRLAESYGHTAEIKTYHPDDFERMIDETKPDAVIVCTTDALHHEYIIRALDKGCEVVCEKPITVDAEKCRAIFEAVERTKGKVRVTFNVRWSPGVTKVRELIDSGVIGKVKHVKMEYMLNTIHGADYFRRWHSEKDQSGGLLVHKSTHHFDLINWWINSIPETVYGIGDLVFYGKENAIARGDEALTTYDRYLDADKEKDPYYFDLHETVGAKGLYLDAEEETGYIRDRNIFREGIDIEDSMSVLIRYRNGIMFNYSLNAYCPEEGFRASISGDKGRIEYEEMHRAHIISGQSNEELAKDQEGSVRRLKVLPLHAPAYFIEIPKPVGGHGGGDLLIQQQIFMPEPPADPFERSAGPEQGVASAIIGIAANESMKTGLPVKVTDLVNLKPCAVKLNELN